MSLLKNFFKPAFLRAAAWSIPLAALPAALNAGPAEPKTLVPQIDSRGHRDTAPQADNIVIEDLNIDPMHSGFDQMTHAHPHTPKDLFACVTNPEQPFTEKELDRVHSALEKMENWLAINGFRNNQQMRAFINKAAKDNPEDSNILQEKYDRFLKYTVVYAPATREGREFLMNNPLQVIEIIGVYYDLKDGIAPFLNDRLSAELERKIDPLMEGIAQQTAEGGREIQQRMNDKCPKLGDDYIKRQMPHWH